MIRSPLSRLGEAHRSLTAGKLNEALALCTDALRDDPHHVKALHLAGLVRAAMGQSKEAFALLQKAAANSEDEPVLLASLAGSALEIGNFQVAHAALERAYLTGRASRETKLNLAQLRQQVGNVSGAQDILQSLMAKQKDGEAAKRLGNLLAGSGRTREAIEAYHVAAATAPENSDMAHNLGTQYFILGMHDVASEWFKKALVTDPNKRAAIEGLANIAETLGDMDAATSLWRRLCVLDPASGRAHAGLINVLADKCPVEDLEAAVAVASRPGLDRSDQALLGYAIGKVLDKLGDYDRAMHWFDNANAARRGNDRFDRQALKRGTDELIATFSCDMLQGINSGKAERPIFIVGMPRSGTTLLEQILGAHPCVFPAGELETIGRSVARIDNEAAESRDYPSCMADISQDQLATIAEDYLEQLALRGWQPHLRSTDKMPINFHHLGVIAKLFPNAIFFHCTRHPLDTCLSCYAENFASHQTFATDLEDLAEYYIQYRRLMDHWLQALPNIMEISYEQLVQNPEPMVRSILEHAGLSWNSACLDHGKTRKMVNTPSRWQVRKPIYTSSIDRWRHYEAHIGLLISALTPLLAHKASA